MNQRFLITSLILFVTIMFDQVSKRWAMSLPTLYFNQGFIMGLYSGLPDHLRIVVLGCFAGLTFFIFVLLLYIIPPKASILAYALSLLMGGMFGNVIDKIMIGKSIDFIPFNYFGIYTVFNFADVFLWVGAFIVIFVLFKKDKLIWFPASTRKSIMVLPKEQYKTGLNFMLIVLCCSVIFGIFSYSFFNTTVAPHTLDKAQLMETYFFSYIMITILSCSVAFLSGIVISHRSVGPVYAFKHYINDLLEGRDRKLIFREGDNYMDLLEVADKLRDHINKIK